MNVRLWRVVLFLLMIYMFVASSIYFVEASTPDVPTMMMIVDAPQTAEEGTIIILHVRFFNIEPNDVIIRAFTFNGYSQNDRSIVLLREGESTLGIPLGSYRRESFSAKVPMFSDKYPNEASWLIRWGFTCIYDSQLYDKTMAFVSSATTIVTSSKTTNEPDINENGLIIQTSSITLAPGEAGKTTMTVMNLLPVDLSCTTSVHAFNSESKGDSLSLSPFESKGVRVSISVPASTDPGTYTYLAGVNAHTVTYLLQGKSFVAYASGVVNVEERESSGDLDFDCIIATAAYGSTMNPTVSMMRHLRDSKIGSTFTGCNFVEIFNRWYYSWSPQVADVVEKTDTRRTAARVLLTPLTQAMTASNSIYDFLSWSPEIASIMALQSTAYLCGLLYVSWPILLVPKKLVSKLNLNPVHCLVPTISFAILMMLFGHITLNKTINGFGIVLLSVITMMIGAYSMIQIINKLDSMRNNVGLRFSALHASDYTFEELES